MARPPAKAPASPRRPAPLRNPAASDPAARLAERLGHRLRAFAQRPYLAPLLVFALAVVAQSWILGLSFQLDDYRLLADPFAIFEANRLAYEAPEAAGYEPFMLRWTSWALWGLLHPLAGDPLEPLAFHIAGLLLHGATAALLTICVRRLIGGPRKRRRAEAPKETSSALEATQFVRQLAASVQLAGKGAKADPNAPKPPLPGHPHADAIAILAGVLFALAAGGLQAVSWTSAHPDLLVAFFGLGALALFLRARDSQHSILRPLGAALACAALLSKTPAAVVWPAIVLLLLITARRHRHRWPELAWLLLALGGAALARWQYLGTLRLRYFETEPPALADIPLYGLAALQLLGQALLPWNRDPAFAEHASWIGRFVPLSAPLVAAIAFVPPLIYGLVRSSWRVQLSLGVGLAITVAFALPGALLYTGAPTNVLSRAVYLPLLPLCATLAIAAGGWFRAGAGRGALWRGVPVVGTGLLLLWSLLFIDGRAHVRATEQVASDQRDATLALTAEAVRTIDDQRGGELHLLMVLPDAGLGGIPALGPHIVRACREPFARVPKSISLGVSHFGSEAALLASLPAMPLSGANVQAFGPQRAETADEAAEGAAALSGSIAPAKVGSLAARAIRPWSPLRRGWRVEPDLRWALAGDGEGAELWVPDPPIPAHELGAVLAEFPVGPAGTGTLGVLQGDNERELSVAFEAAAEGGAGVRRWAAQPCATIDERLGEPVSGLRWTWGPDGRPLSAPPRRLAKVPTLEVSSPDPKSTLSLADTTAIPTFVLGSPIEDLGGARWLRLEFSVVLTDVPVSVFSDTPLPTKLARTERFEFQPIRIHGDPLLPPGDAPEAAADWRAMAQGLRESLAAQGRHEGFAEWRLTAHHPGGALAAASPFFSIFLRTGPDAP